MAHGANLTLGVRVSSWERAESKGVSLLGQGGSWQWGLQTNSRKPSGAQASCRDREKEGRGYFGSAANAGGAQV